MTETQLSYLWKFARGDLERAEFEPWLYEQSDLDLALGDELQFRLSACDFSNRDEVWAIRKELRDALQPYRQCECPLIRDRDVIPMGGEFYSETFFATLDRVVEFGPPRWWLYIDKCRACGTIWLIAQDDRVYDEFFLQRIGDAELRAAELGNWPKIFSTYEQVLAAGRELSSPPIYLDPVEGLLGTVEDLLRERSMISMGEVAHLLGVGDYHAKRLMKLARIAIGANPR